MAGTGVYSLALERLQTEKQQSFIRVVLAVITVLVLFNYHFDRGDSPGIALDQVIIISTMFLAYSTTVWVLIKWMPESLRFAMALSSFIEVFLITYLVFCTIESRIPFYLWYIFFVVNVATRYGWQHSVVALSASLVSFSAVVVLAPNVNLIDVPFALGFTGFMLVLAFMFGQISEKQLNYQASLAVVNEFRAELSAMSNSKEVINFMLDRTRLLLNVEKSFFLPAQRGGDASEAPGIRSGGTDPALMSFFREGGGNWNVEDILREQKPLLSNRLSKDKSLESGLASKMGLRNMVAAPMVVSKIPVGVLYAANRRIKSFSHSDLVLAELIATQVAPVIENALLWERLREAAASEERLRIARDLHDSVLQTLAAIKLHLERCRLLIPKDPAASLDGIGRIHEIATRGLAEVRTYLSELRMVEPEPGRFRQIITRTAEDAAAKGGFTLDVDVNTPDRGMRAEVALAAFQIVRELLQNTANHSHAKNVSVRVFTREDKLIIDLADDGVGFDVAKTRAVKVAEGHLGLVGVDERARQTDGTFTITSELGNGTHAQVTLKL